LKILGPQVSVEERTCGPSDTPAPAAPETDSTRPDVIPPVYDDLNTLSRKKEEPLSPPMYHVLEGPTPAQHIHATEEDKEEGSPINNEPQQDGERDTSFNSVSL
jgi:hypothetical protein